MNNVSELSGGIVTYDIKIEGQTIPNPFQIRSVIVEQVINKITSATVMILDGCAPNEDFTASDSKYFVPGNKITIEAGYDSTNQTIFSGVITSMRIKIDDSLGPIFEFSCKDTAVKMTVGRKNKNYQQMTDSSIMNDVINNYSDLRADVASTSTELAEMAQYYSTDWDFILARSKVNGLLVSCLNDNVRVFDPYQNIKPVFTVTYGDNLYSLDAELNSITQLFKATASAWDPITQQVIEGSNINTDTGPGNLSSSKLAKVVDLDNFQLQTPTANVKEELENWSKAQMNKNSLGKITGEVRFQGTASVNIGHYITLAGVGDRFNGDHFVSKIRHEIVDGNWFVDAHFGLKDNSLTPSSDILSPVTADFIPGVKGLQTAKVKSIHEDPDSGYRILITLPLLDSQHTGIWARLSNFYSSSGFGAFFIPEVDDEVIVGFLNDDPRYPIILGSMYSQSRKPFNELQPNQDNRYKAIVTESETRLVFNDKDIQITITTPSGNTVLLDDKNKQISITDQHANAVVMSSNGINLKSPENINIHAEKKVTINGKNGVDINASGGDINSTAMNISNNADITFSAKGNASAAVASCGELSIKAPMVLIN